MKEKLFKNTNGEFLYLFNWVGGGFNDVWAPNKKEAYRRVVNERKNWEEKNPTYSKLCPIKSKTTVSVEGGFHFNIVRWRNDRRKDKW